MAKIKKYPKWIYFKSGAAIIVQSKEEHEKYDKDDLCASPASAEQIKDWKVESEKKRLFPIAHEEKKKKAKKKE